MQSKRLCLVLACILLPLAGCDSTQIAGTSVARTFFMYSRDGEIVDLPVSTVVFSIGFADGLTDAERDAVLTTQPSARPLSDQVASGNWEESLGFITIAIEPGLTPEQVLAMLERLSARNTVIYANPGFERGLHYNVFGEDILASFPLSMPTEEIDALNASFAVEVVSIREFSALDLIEYQLRVTEETGLNAVDTANAYHADPITNWAQPLLKWLEPEVSCCFLLPEVTLLSPEEGGVTTSDTLEIRWFDRDPNSVNDPDGAFPPDAEIRLFLDTDSEGRNGMLIANGISEDDETDTFLWDTTGVPVGTYYIFAEMYDRLWAPVYSYSPGPVHIVSR